MEIFKSKKAAVSANTNTTKEPITESQFDLDRLDSISRTIGSEGLDAGSINLNFGVIEDIINKYDKEGKHPADDLLKKMLNVSDKMLAKLSNDDFIRSNKEYLGKSNIVQHAKDIKARIEKYLA